MQKIRDAGWIAFLLLLAGICFLYWEKIEKKLPFRRTPELQHRLQLQCNRLAKVPWKDNRPICLFLGDSHIELGGWYELFHGRFAVINAGVSMARVKDVTSVIAQGSASAIDTVVVMCGINDLGYSENPEGVRQDFRRLLDQIAANIRPRRTIVLSVMPVLVSGPGDHGAIACNASVRELNLMLASMVWGKGMEYLDVTPLLWEGRGMKPEFTFDGLHLNDRGYQVIANAVGKSLEHPSGSAAVNANP
jgi:lysophospholipase L1-like esterase